MNSKNRIYEVCLSAFFLFSTTACTSMGNSSADLDDLDVDLLAVLTEPEQSSSDDQRQDAEMVSNYQNQAEGTETQLVEGFGDPFGEVFSETGDSELAGEDQGNDADPNLSYDNPAALENDAARTEEGTDLTRTQTEAKKDLTLENFENIEAAGNIETETPAGILLASADTALQAPEDQPMAADVTPEDQPMALESDLDEQESLEILLDGVSGEKPVSDELIRNQDADDALLLAAIGDDTSNLELEADDKGLIAENEVQDNFLSDIIVSESGRSAKKSNYLAQTTFEPDSDIPMELEENDTWEMNLEQVIAQTADESMPNAARMSDTIIASVASASAPESLSTKILVPDTILANVRIAANLSRPMPQDAAGVEEIKTNDEDFEDISIAMLAGVSDDPTTNMPASDVFVAAAAVEIPQMAEFAQIQANNSKNYLASNSDLLISRPETVHLEKQKNQVLLKRLDPKTLHQRLLQLPETVVYSGKTSASGRTTEKMVKVIIDGKAALVTVHKVLSVNTAAVKKTARVTAAVKTAKIHAKTPVSVAASVSLSEVKSGRSMTRSENFGFRLALNKNTTPADQNRIPAVPVSTNSDDAERQHRSAYDLTNRIILPKREDLSFG